MAQPRIFTPDRRLRVFVSSTLRELALERVAAREAISSLHLAPVLFEQGARPHPPRDLYAAYVDQCDVFVGIYWQSYGWVAPGATISGLEDEYELASSVGKPMLLYVKGPAPEREERLTGLLNRIQRDGGSAYRGFATADELGSLVTDDLALLLTERFHATADAPDDERLSLPARTTSFVGRDDELSELERLVEREDVRLVTLTGPGGIGKTRLAVEVARRLAPRFRDGVAYVALDRLADAELLPDAVAEALGLPPPGPDPAALAHRLRAKRLLLVLDNFEHLLGAAPLVTQLLESASELEVLATSREPLRLQGEHEYAVPTLGAAPQLFRERVAAVRPDVAWDEANVRAAEEICRRVDGLPLAVELVAAGARMFTPAALVDHVAAYLHAPTSGRRDAPARQQTIRAAIDWSYGLLTDSERDLFERLGSFDGSFTIEAVLSVAGAAASQALGTLSALVDKSLLLHTAEESETRFRMLQLVGEYALERLCERDDADEVLGAHADHYRDLGRAAYSGLRGREQRGWNDVLDLESANVRRALQYLARARRLDEAADLAWSVFAYWLTGSMLEGRKVVEELLASREPMSGQARARLQTVDGLLSALLADLASAQAQLQEALAWYEGQSDLEGKASVLAGLGIATAPFDSDRARTLLGESADLFARIGDRWGESMALGALGWLDTGRGDFSERDLFERAYGLACSVGDDVATAHAATNLAELHLADGEPERARELLDVALDGFEALRIYDGLSYGLEAAARLAATASGAEEAALLLGAAQGLRDEAGVPIWGARLDRFEALLSSVREVVGAEPCAAIVAEGQALDFEAALASARHALERYGVPARA